MNAPLDLVVVGAGPVGLATAVEAARAGLRVAVVEHRGLVGEPLDKACGEGLMPGAVQALARLGVEPAGVPLEGIAYVDGTRRAQARFPGGPGRGVRRTELSRALGVRAEEVGVVRARGRVTGLAQDDDGVDVTGPDLALRARWAVAADGLHSPVRRLLGLEGVPSRSPARYGLRRHYRVEPWTDLVEVHWAGAGQGECYVTPVAPDLVGVALLGPRGGRFSDRLSVFAQVVARLGDAEPDGSVLGAGPLHQTVTARRSGRVLLVGDAAGYVDALTGEGVAVGLAGARALVEALVRDAPEDYEAAWRTASRRYRLLTSGLLRVSSLPLARRAMVPAAVAAPRVFAGVVGQLAR